MTEIRLTSDSAKLEAVRLAAMEWDTGEPSYPDVEAALRLYRVLGEALEVSGQPIVYHEREAYGRLGHGAAYRVLRTLHGEDGDG